MVIFTKNSKNSVCLCDFLFYQDVCVDFPKILDCFVLRSRKRRSVGNRRKRHERNGRQFDSRPLTMKYSWPI